LVFPLIGLGANVLRFLPFLKQTGEHVDYELYKNTGDWNIRRMFADIPNTGFHSYLYCLKQLYGFNRKNRLGEIAVPVLIVHGTKDSLVPYENSVEVAKKIKNSKFVTIEGANHILILNNFEETARAIEKFLI
jgi:pimeloyl-ACP methyl ester carboxylesterase